jgi:HD-like signal output (HDOD) protein
MISDFSMPAVCTLTPEELAREVTHLPSAPKVLPRLKQLLGDGNSAMHKIVELVRLDLGISARVLQVANSAYYSKGTRCFTVDEAVNRVGYDQVYDLVAYAVASQVLVRPLAAYGMEADELWMQSVACALAAEVLALHTGQDRNVAYTNGLLHSIGMVAIDEWANRNARSLSLKFTGFPREASESERAVFGFTQADAGAALLRNWDFPREMTEPVRWQYAPRASAGFAKMACLLHAAKWLRTVVCRREDTMPPLPDPAHLQALSLSPALLRGMSIQVEMRLGEITSLLDVEGARHGERFRFPSRN